MDTTPVVLDPRINPTLSIPEAGRVLCGLGRAASYAAAREGRLPGLIDIGGRKKRISTAAVRIALGMPAEPVNGTPTAA